VELTTLGDILRGPTFEQIQFGGTDDEIKLFGYCDASQLPHGDSKPRLKTIRRQAAWILSQQPIR
jgi:hypothetical protein